VVGRHSEISASPNPDTANSTEFGFIDCKLHGSSTHDRSNTIATVYHRERWLITDNRKLSPEIH
jgi:hypothetical protein